MKSIKLEMLTQLAFGQEEHVNALLTEVQNEIVTKRTSWREHQFSRSTDELFRNMHQLKATLGMLQCGPYIWKCQMILNQMEGGLTPQMVRQVDLFFDEIEVVLEELEQYTK